MACIPAANLMSCSSKGTGYILDLLVYTNEVMTYRKASAAAKMPSGYDDFDFIAPRLAQGSYPDHPPDAFTEFDVVVFCAKELQPRNVKHHPAQSAVFVPMDDDPYRPIDPPSGKTLHGIARKLANAVQGGKRVLITCAAGMNRSGLVTGLTLVYLGWSGADAVKTIRTRRRKDEGQEALFNPIFAQYVATAKRAI